MTRLKRDPDISADLHGKSVAVLDRIGGWIMVQIDDRFLWVRKSIIQEGETMIDSNEGKPSDERRPQKSELNWIIVMACLVGAVLIVILAICRFL